jgi:hypothetical protein
MTWYGGQQRTLTFSEEDRQQLKKKLEAVVERKSPSETKDPKTISRVDMNKNFKADLIQQ